MGPERRGQPGRPAGPAGSFVCVRAAPLLPSLRLLCALQLVLAGPVRADDSVAARQAYEEGVRRYALREWEVALAAFKRAYLAHASPALLYNIAQCHRMLGNRREAVEFYGTYLQLEPDTPDRAMIEDHIAALAAPQPLAAPAAGPAQPPEVRRPTPGPAATEPRRVWPWAVAGGGLAAILAVVAGIAVALAPRDPPLPAVAFPVEF